MRLVLAVLLTMAMGVAMADQTYRFTRGVVTVGDTVSALVERAGKPDRIVALQNGYGAGVGERWEYYLPDGKMVSFYISGGRIYQIDDAS